jgi:MoaA/NifB/PqqE/SkfB family radical SAM enzyme
MQPKVLLIEITSRCNADCVICGRGWWKDGALIGDLPFETYCAVIDRLDCVESVKLGQYGEPLMYREIVEAVAYAKERGKYVWLTTNASLLTEHRAKALLDAGLDKIIFSVDAIDRETFERVRPPLRWKNVIDNISRFCLLREGYEIHALVNAIITPDGNTTAEEFKAFWGTIGLGCWRGRRLAAPAQVHRR